jgi:hypothetical protein
MRKCPDCGFEFSDDVTQCVTCHTALVPPASSAQSEPVVGPQSFSEDRLLVERTIFGKFTILIVRLQAVWLLIDALIEITYIPPYLERLNEVFANYQHLRTNFLMLILRIVLYMAAALGVLQYADRLVIWLLNDLITNKRDPNL